MEIKHFRFKKETNKKIIFTQKEKQKKNAETAANFPTTFSAKIIRIGLVLE
jgi:hypothetical protein